MPRYSERADREDFIPYFEGLEERLLLTTIRGGESLIYHASQGETVRLTVNGAPSDVIEVFAHHTDLGPMGGLSDMPGLLDGYTPVGWGDYPNIPLTAMELMRPDDPNAAEPNYTHIDQNDPVWLEYGDRLNTGNSDPNDIDTWGPPIPRTSRADIYAIYVVECSPTMSITISTLSGTPFVGNDWMTRVDPWASSNLPILIAHPEVRSPGGSGGVLIGAMHAPERDRPNQYVAVGSSTVIEAPLTGVFAGGPVTAGITVADDMFRLATPVSLGSDVGAVAARPPRGFEPPSSVHVYAIDNSPFQGKIINETDAGDLGDDINAIAVDLTGELFVVTNSRQPLVVQSQRPVGSSVPALAVTNSGIFYAIDDGGHRLVRIDPSLPARDMVEIVGQIVDAGNDNWRFEGFAGLDYHTDGQLWGIATRAGQDLSDNDKGTFLVTVPTSADGGKIKAVPVVKLDKGSLESLPGFGSLVWSGSSLYGVTNANELYNIDPTTGAISNRRDLRLSGGVALSSIVGLDYIGTTLYGIGNDGNIYVINPAAPGSCVLIGNAGQTGMGALAYDPTRPHRLYTVLYSDGLRLAAIPIWSSLVNVDRDGTSAYVNWLYDSVSPNYAFRDVTALEFDSFGTLYASATVIDVSTNLQVGTRQYLVTINTSTGETTRAGQLNGGPTYLSTMTFEAGSGTFYAVDSTTDALWVINPGSGLGISSTALVGAAGIVGLELMDVGDGTQMLLGVTPTSLYHVDPASGTCTLISDTGMAGLSSLAYYSWESGVLYSTEQAVPGEGYRLATIALSAPVTYTDASSVVSTISHLFDYDELGMQFNRTWGYTDIRAMDYGPDDWLYAIASVVSLDENTAPAPIVKQLVRIHPDYGQVVSLGNLAGAADLTSVAFDELGVLWGVDPGANNLVTVDTVTTPGQTAVVAPLSVSGLIGIDFVNGELYGATSSHLYSIDTTTGLCTPVELGILSGTVTGLSTNPNDPLSFWAPAEFSGNYYLIRAYTDPNTAVQDIGRIIVGGTVAGDVQNAGNTEMVRMGFLWGNVNVGKNLDKLILEQGGGNVGIWSPLLSRVDVEGNLNYVHIRGGSTSTAIQVDNAPENTPLGTFINELEIDVRNMDVWRAGWIAGDLVHLNGVGYDNNVMERAQFLNHPSGTFSISGTITIWEDPGQLPSPIPGDINEADPGQPVSYYVDWYAFPLLAGQTVHIDSIGLSPPNVILYDSEGNWMDSYGWETIEDWGVGSIGMTLKPIDFTAMAAGTYYMAVMGSMYTLLVENATAGALGGINVNGNYDVVPVGHTGTAEAAFDNIAVKHGGTLGAYVVSGTSNAASLHTIGGGDIVCFEVGQTGGMNAIRAEGSAIGRLGSTTGSLGINAIAGYIPAGAAAPLFNDAPVQNVDAWAMLGGLGVSATGSIGVIEVGTDMAGVEIFANYDHVLRTDFTDPNYDPTYDPGPAGHIDLIEVGGDYGGMMIGVPVLKRGPEGNVGYVHVGGDIYIVTETGILTRDPTVVTNGVSKKVYDDGGGELTLSPVTTEVLDPATGEPMIDPVTYEVITYTPTYSYNLVGVDDDYFPTTGDGGAIANISSTGSLNITGIGPAQIGKLDLSYTTVVGVPDVARDVKISGNGPVDVYHVICDGPWTSFVNNTKGRLVSGDIQGVDRIQVGGSIGIDETDAGGWTHGPTTGPPVLGTLSEPQYGYYNGKINGLNIIGDVGEVIVGGALGDLRCEGTIGSVLVDADRQRPADEWHGVYGLVWARTRIDAIDVGDGLADDGPSDRAIAAIMSSSTIGRVTISGPKYAVVDGETGVETIYGELNGSILGLINDFDPITLPDGTTQLRERHSVAEVIGTDSAHLTAIIGGQGLDTFQCFRGTSSTTGGVGSIHMSGEDAQIYGSEITGFYVRSVVCEREVTSELPDESYGMEYVFINGEHAYPDEPAVGRVAAGGDGMYYVSVNANGGDINRVEGLGAEADIVMGRFISSDGLRNITARDLDFIDIHAPGIVDRMAATRDVIDLRLPYPGGPDPGVFVGAINELSVGRNFQDNYFLVAGQIGRMTVGGQFIGSEIELRGGAANLGFLSVQGDISGRISSAGRIGTLTSVNGQITADVATLLESGAVNADIQQLSAAQGFTGSVSVAGTLHNLVCHTDLGAPGVSQTFDIMGDLGRLRVAGSPADPNPDLYVNFNVGGNVGTIDVDGDYHSEMIVLGNLSQLIVDGSLAGGELNVYGEIGFLRFSRLGDLVADIISGGSIQFISLFNGSLVGNLVSRYGEVMGVSVVNGDILGNVSGTAIRTVLVSNGNLRGDLTATNGGIRNVTVSRGDLTGDIVAENGRIDVLRVIQGDLGDPTRDYQVAATRGIGFVQVAGGDLLANIDSGGRIDALSVQGNMSNLLLNSDGGLRSLDVLGDVTGAVVRSGAKIDRFLVRGNLADSTVSAAWDIGAAQVNGNMTNSRLLAGYDLGVSALSVLLGDGTGAFAKQAVYPFGNGPQGLAAGDLNGDGDLDFVTANELDDSVSLMLSDGAGGFGPYVGADVGAAPVAVAIGDLDGANELDIVTANRDDGTVTVLLSDGAGGYTRTDHPVGTQPVAVAIADLDGANELDLAVVNEADGDLALLLGDGAGGYTAGNVSVGGPGTEPSAVAVADLDGANQLDLVVAKRGTDSVSILLEDGAGGYTPTEVLAGSHPADVAVADLDGLNEPDLIVVNQGSDTISVMLGNGVGGYGEVPYRVGDAPTAVFLADVDGDTDLDMFVANSGDNTVLAFPSDGDGSFGLATVYRVGHSPQDVVVADFNGDTEADVIVANRAAGANPLTGGAPHAGNINSLIVLGDFDASVVAAGVGPGDDADYTTLADNVEAPGSSKITRMLVRGDYLNPGSSAVVADTAIDSWFLTQARAAGVNVVASESDFVTTVLDGAGTDFGRGSGGALTWTDGTLTITLTAGRANYDGAGNLVLEETSAASALIFRNTGAPVTVDITGSEDSALAYLSVIGDVTLGDIDVDGPVGSIVAGEVADGATWHLPGGVRAARLNSLTNVDIDAGAILSWYMLGAYNSGSISADSIWSFVVRGDANGNVTTKLGDVMVFQSLGACGGDVTVQGAIRTMYVLGAFTGNLVVERGDLTVMVVTNGFSGTADVRRGGATSVVITGGDFGGLATTAFRASTGLYAFVVSRGDLSGLLSVDGDIRVIQAALGVASGRIRAAGDIMTAYFGSMNGATLTAGNDLSYVRVLRDMTASRVFAGFDPGDAGYDADHGGESANIQIDAFTPAAWRTEGNADRTFGGNIQYVWMGRDMGSGTTISAALAPGLDGYCGTDDDQVNGAGYIRTVVVTRNVHGLGLAGESYGIYAASNLPAATWHRGVAFAGNGYTGVGTAPRTMGRLAVEGVGVQLRSVSVKFNHAIDFSTISTEYVDPTAMPTVQLLAFLLSDYSDVPTDVTATVPHTIAYNAANAQIVLTLSGTTTFNNLGLGNYYRLTLTGEEIRDNRGTKLDGDGDGTPAGDFVYEFAYGQRVIDVPSYQLWHGEAPTGLAMILGLYDMTPDYMDMFPGSAMYMTTAIRDQIASAEHITDYAFFQGIDDSGSFYPEPDLSDPLIQSIYGVSPHLDNSIADFMKTSQSYVDGVATGRVYGETFFSDVPQGIIDYVTSLGLGYELDLLLGTDSNFTWLEFLDEIDNRRPMLLHVDTDLDGMGDSYVVGVGYNVATQKYAAYVMGPSATTLEWYDYTVGGFADHSIVNAVTIQFIP